MKPHWEVACHALVAAFVARRIQADDFLRRFDHLWQDDDGGGDRVLTSIRVLCDTYSCALPAGAGYRVSEAQLRQEVGNVAASPRTSAARHDH